MADDVTPPVKPGALDRSALERVLARAAELQAGEANPADATVTESQLLEIGKEVGLAPEHLRQALAEERTRVAVPEESGMLAELLGAAWVRATRTVTGQPDQIFAQLDEWMQREECLQERRRFPDRMLWERRQGLVTDFRRALNVGGRGYYLTYAAEVSATVVSVDAGRVIVRLDANFTNVRLARAVGGGAMAGLGAASTAALLVMGIMAPIAAIPAVALLAGGYAVSRSHGPLVRRAQLALEQVLDRLERGDLPRPSLLAAITATARMLR